ncbi:MAG TPA: hypothetical protein VHY37_03280 [Tepidisphaeraceae bacterium]|jgi:hypothetical protein|nr:hypothetical protein [Tepidisphaeraceae bacterium]
MSKDEIIAELARLSAAERAEVQKKLDEISGAAWESDAELTEADKHLLDQSLAEYQGSQNPGTPWSEVKERILNKLK